MCNVHQYYGGELSYEVNKTIIIDTDPAAIGAISDKDVHIVNDVFIHYLVSYLMLMACIFMHTYLG